MAQVTLIAQHSISLAGQSYEPGQRFEVDAELALELVKIHSDGAVPAARYAEDEAEQIPLFSDETGAGKSEEERLAEEAAVAEAERLKDPVETAKAAADKEAAEAAEAAAAAEAAVGEALRLKAVASKEQKEADDAAAALAAAEAKPEVVPDEELQTQTDDDLQDLLGA